MHEQEETLNALREALALSPTNVILRSQYAKMLMARGRFEEAETVFRTGLEQSPQSEQLQIGLAKCYHKLGNTSAALVIIETLIQRPDCPADVYIQYTKLLLAKGQLEEAADAYCRAIELDKSLVDENLASTPAASTELRSASPERLRAG